MPDRPPGPAGHSPPRGRTRLHPLVVALGLFAGGFALAWVGHWLGWRWLQWVAFLLAVVAVNVAWADTLGGFRDWWSGRRGGR